MNSDKQKAAKIKAPRYRNPARYRLEFIHENTLMTLWSVRMTRVRVWIVSLSGLAAVLALLWVVVAFTPLRQLLPGALHGDLRARYMETALKLDSLESAARQNEAYINNIRNIFAGPKEADHTNLSHSVALSDSLLAASELEKQFVRSYEEEERFNLSVLAPIAAEGMIFQAPVASAASVASVSGAKALEIQTGALTPASAVYRGTVVASTTGADGRTTITIQHPNDFISVYQGLSDVFVEKGDKVEAAQRIGHIAAKGRLTFELWHSGSPLNPRDYIAI